MIRLRSCTSVAILVLLCCLAVQALLLPAATAQTSVVGSADFRNAPQLGPGEFRDTIVTGDTAWYSLLYTNNTPYRFEVSVLGGSADLTASFVAPTLAVVVEDESVVQGSGVEYPVGTTNEWFLKVTASSPTGQDGVEVQVLIDVDGVEEAGLADCADVPGCTYEQEFTELSAELESARAALAEQQARPTTANVERDITNLEGFIGSTDALTPASDARLARAEAQMERYCAPDAFCDEFPDPKPNTPIVGLALGLGVLAFGAYRAVKKFQAAKPDEPDEPELADPGGDAPPPASSAFAMGSGS